MRRKAEIDRHLSYVGVAGRQPRSRLMRRGDCCGPRLSESDLRSAVHQPKRPAAHELTVALFMFVPVVLFTPSPRRLSGRMRALVAVVSQGCAGVRPLTWVLLARAGSRCVKYR